MHNSISHAVMTAVSKYNNITVKMNMLAFTPMMKLPEYFCSAGYNLNKEYP
jgi:hypothetical protein